MTGLTKCYRTLLAQIEKKGVEKGEWKGRGIEGKGEWRGRRSGGEGGIKGKGSGVEGRIEGKGEWRGRRSGGEGERVEGKGR